MPDRQNKQTKKKKEKNKIKRLVFKCFLFLHVILLAFLSHTKFVTFGHFFRSILLYSSFQTPISIILKTTRISPVQNPRRVGVASGTCPSQRGQSCRVLSQSIDLRVEDAARILGSPVQQGTSQSGITQSGRQVQQRRASGLKGFRAGAPRPHHGILNKRIGFLIRKILNLESND